MHSPGKKKNDHFKKKKVYCYFFGGRVLRDTKIYIFFFLNMKWIGSYIFWREYRIYRFFLQDFIHNIFFSSYKKYHIKIKKYREWIFFFSGSIILRILKSHVQLDLHSIYPLQLNIYTSMSRKKSKTLKSFRLNFIKDRHRIKKYRDNYISNIIKK